MGVKPAGVGTVLVVELWIVCVLVMVLVMRFVLVRVCVLVPGHY